MSATFSSSVPRGCETDMLAGSLRGRAAGRSPLFAGSTCSMVSTLIGVLASLTEAPVVVTKLRTGCPSCWAERQALSRTRTRAPAVAHLKPAMLPVRICWSAGAMTATSNIFKLCAHTHIHAHAQR
jgi:hypothetical protein